MHSTILIFLVEATICILISDVVSSRELRFADGDYIVKWRVTEPLIKFTLTVKTTGWVGLGIGPNPNMGGADLFIGGIRNYENQLYYNDYHAAGNGTPATDNSPNWVINREESFQNATTTVLSIYRRLVTSDGYGQDNPIRNEEVYLIWSYGANDDTSAIHTRRGSQIINLLEDEAATTENQDTTTPGGEDIETTTLDESEVKPTAAGGSETIGKITVLIVVALAFTILL